MSIQSNYNNYLRADAVTTILGSSENGKPLDSAIPFIYDEWFHGDFRTSRPSTLSGARGTKSPNEYSRTFPNFRLDSVIEIGHRSSNRQTISSNDWTVSFSKSNQSEITLEGETYNPFRDNTVFGNIDGSKNYLGSEKQGPYKTSKKITIKNQNETPIDGIRASTIYGGKDQYLTKAKKMYGLTSKKLAELAQKGRPENRVLAPHALNAFIRIPTFYTFIDAVYMADGTKVVRMWDASPYPAHDLYVDGQKVGQGNKFREGIEWTKNGQIHRAFGHFAYEANTPGYTPFDRGGAFGYRSRWKSGHGDHPVTEVGVEATNPKITPEQIIKKTPTPQFPSEV